MLMAGLWTSYACNWFEAGPPPTTSVLAPNTLYIHDHHHKHKALKLAFV